MKTPTEQDKQKFQRAMHEFKNGDQSEAIRLFEEVRSSWQDDPDILYLEGSAWGKLGRPNKVVETSEKALALNPGHYGALCNLANALMLMGDQEHAIENYEKARAIKPDAPEILDNYGRALGMLGRREEAIELYVAAVASNPSHAPVHASLGRAYVESGKPNDAMQEFDLALQLDPDEYRAHLGIAGLYMGAGGLERAEHHYNEAYRLGKSSMESHLGMASFESLRGNRKRALEILSDAESLGIGNNFIINACKAECLEHLGEFEEAYKIVRELAEQEQMSPTAVITYARLCRKFNHCDEALELIQMSADAPSTDSAQTQTLFYTAGAVLDRLERYEEAFEYYQRANESVQAPMMRNRIPLYDYLINFFTREKLAELPRAQTGSDRPIFILGMPRSGTSLTEQILSSHPDVYGAGELHNLVKISADIGKTSTTDSVDYISRLKDISAEELTVYANRYLGEIGELNDTSRFVTDKMPHNFELIGLIMLLFPQARIIHCRRNPLDNGLSIYFQSFIWSHDYATSLDAIGKHYGEYDRIMRHWESVIDMPILTIQYEDMIADQQGMSRRLLEFCDLEWDDAVMKFHESERNVATASYDQVRQPMYQSSRARWKNYAGHLKPLKDALPAHCVLGIQDIDLIDEPAK